MSVIYADVADTLPLDVREAIEASAPCAGGFAHLWDREAVDNVIGARTGKWLQDVWRCVHCDATLHSDPMTAS